MRFFAPKSFKNGDYYFNKYDKVDLFVLSICIALGALICITGFFTIVAYSTIVYAIVLVTIGTIIILSGLLLTMPVEIHHNLLGRFKCMLSYWQRQKVYKWNGYDYDNYQEDSQVKRR